MAAPTLKRILLSNQIRANTDNRIELKQSFLLPSVSIFPVIFQSDSEPFMCGKTSLVACLVAKFRKIGLV